MEVVGCDGAGEGDWEGEYDANVENIATDNIANEEVGFALSCGGDGSDKFGQGSTKCDDGERDDAFGNTDAAGDEAGGAYD